MVIISQSENREAIHVHTRDNIINTSIFICYYC